MLVRTIFYFSAAIGVYHHAVYPLLLRGLAARKYEDREAKPARGGLPSIAVIVPAYNEGAFIAQKIENLAALRYPAGKCSIVIACDGCTDRTVEIAKEAALRYRRAQISIAVLEENLGKIAILNEHISSCEADIVALSDASALLPEDALEKVAARFLDDTIGTVCGTYALPPHAAAGERLYWAYQCKIKAAEAALGA